MGRFRKLAVVVAAGALVAGLGVFAEETPASAAKVANPGSGFTLKIQQGLLRIKEQSFDFNDETRQPQCSDGVNNDEGQDTAVDFAGGDPQCSSALDDSEVASGLQPKTPIQLTGGTINANGTYSFSGVSFPRQYLWVADAPVVGSFQVNIDIVSLAPATGTINANTGAMDLSMSVEVRASGSPLNDGCKVGPINVNGATTGTTSPPGPNTPITGVPYNPATGRVTLVQNSYSVPGASGCTATFLQVDVNGEINGQLGLPSDPGNNEAVFLGEFVQAGTDPQPGVTASFTTTPSSGVAPLNVAVNAGASTGSGLTYRWDWTNDGTFDTVASATATANHVFNAGSHTIRLRATDSGGDFAETTRVVNVGANLPPTANDQTVSTPEDTAKGVTLSGSDPESGALGFTRVAPNPANGSVSCTGTACTYTPNADFTGTDTFGFRVTDPVGQTDDGVVTVNVTPVNDAPTATNVSATVVEDNPGTVTLVGNDVDGDALTYTVVSPPSKGGLSGSGASRTYTPNANENGPDSFTYQVSDPSGALSGIATASITITSVNDAPVADDQVGGNAVGTTEDTAVPVTLSGSDLDGNPLTYGIVTPPAHGSLSGILPNLTYTPAANYNGPDTFVFKVTDNAAATDNGTVDIVVAPANDAPTTFDLSVGTQEDVPVDVTIVADDIDGDPLGYSPSTPTAEGGTVSCAAEVCTYTPASGFAGTDTFTVDVSDGTATVTSTVTVNVSAFNNHAPVLNDATSVLLEDTTRTFALLSADADGNTLTHTVLVPPATGTLSCTSAGACTYTPAANANGTVTATVQVSDGVGGVDTATITLVIIPVNDAPSIPAQSLTTAEDTTGVVSVVATDADGDTPVWTLKRNGAKGSVTCTGDGTCTYVPNANATGADSFDVEADDGHGARIRTTVSVTISPVDDAPVAGTVNKAINEDGTGTVALVGSDPDGGAVTFSAGSATKGTLGCNAAGACSFVAAPNAVGTETVAYTVSDGVSSTTGALVITIVPVNDAPVAQSQTMSTPEDTALPVTLSAIDPDVGDPLTFTVTSAPSMGTLGGTAPNVTYQPGANASGTVSFGFSVRDAAGATSTGTITIVVTPVDDAPVAGTVAVATPEDTAKAIALTGTDAEGGVTVAVTGPPAHGTYSGGIYTPALNYNGSDTIGFQVTSGTGQVANGIALITVTPVNDPPVATDATVSTTRTVPVAITLGASDVDGPGTITYTVLTGPTKGTLSGTAPNLTYTPTGFNTGSDNVTFKVTDSSGATDSGTIGITITAGPALATVLTVSPATVVRPTGLLAFLGSNTYSNLKGTLTTSGGLPVSGKSVKFMVGTATICTATTNASGVATCNGTGPNAAVTSYTGSFAGDAGFAAASGTGSLS